MVTNEFHIPSFLKVLIEISIFLSGVYYQFLLPGAPRVVQTTVRLPLQLVVKPVMPVKNATHKITLDTNKPPVNLNDIFPGRFLCLQHILDCFIHFGHFSLVATDRI